MVSAENERSNWWPNDAVVASRTRPVQRSDGDDTWRGEIGGVGHREARVVDGQVPNEALSLACLHTPRGKPLV